MSNHVDHEAIESSPALKGYYDDRRLFYRNVFWIIFGSSAAAFGQNTAQSLMPLHMASVHLTAQQISNVMAMSGWLGMPLILYASYLTDRWQWKMGRRLPFLAMSLPFMLFGMILFPYTTSVWGCLAIYSVYAFFNQIKYSTYPFLINDISRTRYWGRVTGIGDIFGYCAIGTGQWFLMPLVNTRGEKTVFLIGAGFLLGATLLTILFVKEPPIRSPEKPRFNPIPVIGSTLKFGFSSKWNLLTFVAFALICGQGLVQYYLPLMAKVNLGLPEKEIGPQILFPGTLAMALVSFFNGWAVDHLGPVRAMVIGYAIYALAIVFGFNPSWSASKLSALTTWTLQPVHGLAAAYVLVMIGGSLIYASAIIFVMASVHRKDVATFCACNGAMNLLLQATLMYLSGTLITQVFHENYGVIFFIAISFTSMGIPVFFLIDRYRKKVQPVLTPAGACT